MQRKLLLPATLVAGMFTLTLTNAAGDANADTYILQGEKGESGASVSCVPEPAGGNCTTGGQKCTSASGVGYVCNGAKGDSFFTCNGNDCTTDKNLTANKLHAVVESECPDGYTKDARTDIVLCKRGADEMVKVGDFWVDRYEGVIVDATLYNSGACNGSTDISDVYGSNADNYPTTFKYTGYFSIPAYACSISTHSLSAGSLKDAVPSRYMTWFQAQEACALSGKRLCTNEEWQAAVAGTVDPGSFNGDSGGPCTTSGNGARATGNAGNQPGQGGSCISTWGAEDMIGNVNEWVSMWGQSGGQKGGGGPDVEIYYSGYRGSFPTGQGFAQFAPETTGDVDGTWNLQGGAYGCSASGIGCIFRPGLPFAGVRGGNANDQTRAGAFDIEIGVGPSMRAPSVGFRCCRGR